MIPRTWTVGTSSLKQQQEVLISTIVVFLYSKHLLLYRFSIVQSCWEEKAAHRPPFSELVITIGQLLWSMADYLPMSPSPKDKCQFSMPVDTQPIPSENDNEEAK